MSPIQSDTIMKEFSDCFVSKQKTEPERLVSNRVLLARSVPEAAQLRSRMWMSLRPMRVDWRPIFTSTASMLGECIPQYGDMSSAAHVCSRLAVCAAALAIIASRSET